LQPSVPKVIINVSKGNGLISNHFKKMILHGRDSERSIFK